jgi:hypothetical protein
MKINIEGMRRVRHGNYRDDAWMVNYLLNKEWMFFVTLFVQLRIAPQNPKTPFKTNM